jgi:hypothetical protein
MDQRESLEDIYGDSGNALDAVFQQHDFGHHVYSYRPTNTLSADLGDHIGERLESDINKKHKDAESIDQHKYARLANASYDHFNGKSVHENLRKSQYDYIGDLKDFEMDDELSTKDDLVLHNAKTGETVISYRGTTDDPVGKPKNFVQDWLVNGQIAGGSTHTSRAKTAEKQADQVIQKYGKQNLVVTGHSQGGGISYHIATKYDLEGHHYNPAINHSNVAQAGKYANNKNAQTIYKTHLDFASPLAYSKNLNKSNTTVHTVGTIKGMDSPVSTHSIDQFSPTPLTVHADGTVSVKRQTAKQSIKNGIKHTVTYHPVGKAVVSVTDQLPSLVHKTVDLEASAAKGVSHLGVNLAINEEQAVVDEMIVDASLALAPETMGLSIVAGAGAVYLHHVAGSWVERHVDKVADKAIDTVSEAAHKATSMFFSLF